MNDIIEEPVMDLQDLPKISPSCLMPIVTDSLKGADDGDHKPRILVLYGSLRSVSYARKSAEQGARILRTRGCDVRMFDPLGLTFLGIDGVEPHLEVLELCDLAVWSEDMVCSSPERHGAMLGIMTLQIDWLSLDMGGVRPTQGKTLALMQVFDGSQSCKAVIQMRILGRRMRMVTIPNQSSIPKAFLEGDSDGRLPDAALYHWIVDVMEQLVTFTWPVRGRFAYLVDRYSERVETDAEALLRVVKL